MRWTVDFRYKVCGEQTRDLGWERHEVETLGERGRVQRVERFVFAVAGAEPQSEIVAGFVRERLQMTASGSERPMLLRVMV